MDEGKEFSEKGHNHSITDVAGLGMVLATKAANNHKHTLEDIDSLAERLSELLSTRSTDVSYIRDIEVIKGVLSTKVGQDTIGKITRILHSKANDNHEHLLCHITGLSSVLDSKANTELVLKKVDKIEFLELVKNMTLKADLELVESIQFALKAKLEKQDIGHKADKEHTHTLKDIIDASEILEKFEKYSIDNLLSLIHEKAPKIHRHEANDIVNMKELFPRFKKFLVPVFEIGFVNNNNVPTLLINFESTNGYYTPSLNIQIHNKTKDHNWELYESMKFIDAKLSYRIEIPQMVSKVEYSFQVIIYDQNDPSIKLESNIIEVTL